MKKVNVIFLLVLGTNILPYVATDLYLPSLPAITNYFATSTDTVQQSLTWYLVGFGISPLFFGPASDSYGRRPIMFWGFAIGSVGVGMCLFAANIWFLILGRIIQGFGFGACSAASRPVLGDALNQTQLAQYASYMSMGVSLAIACAPLIGGLVQYYAGWHAVFLVLLCYALGLCFSVWKLLPETNPAIDKAPLHPWRLLKNYGRLYLNRPYMGYVACNSLAFAGFMGYLTASPFLLQDIVKLSPLEYGFVGTLIGCFVMLASIINSRIVVLFRRDSILMAAGIGMFLAGLIGLFWVFFSSVSAWSILLPVSLYALAVPLVFSNTIVGVFSSVDKTVRGSASAMSGGHQILSGAFASWIVSYTPETSAMPFAIGFVFSGLGIIFVISKTCQQSKII